MFIMAQLQYTDKELKMNYTNTYPELYTWMQETQLEEMTLAYLELLKAGWLLHQNKREARIMLTLIFVSTREAFRPSSKQLWDLYSIINNNPYRDVSIDSRMQGDGNLNVNLPTHKHNTKPAYIPTEKNKTDEDMLKKPYIPAEIKPIQMNSAIQAAFDADDMDLAIELGAFGNIKDKDKGKLVKPTARPL